MGQVLRYGLPVMLLGLLAAIVYVLMTAAAGPGDRVPFERYAIGAMEGLDFATAGDVPERVGFVGSEGEMIDLSAFEGRVVLVNLWATWCAPCEKEMPSLGALQRARGGDDFEVVAISVDKAEDADFARSELARLSGGMMRFFHDPEYKVNYALGARGFPTSVIYDRNGEEIARLAGDADWSSAQAVALIDAVLGEQ